MGAVPSRKRSVSWSGSDGSYALTLRSPSAIARLFVGREGEVRRRAELFVLGRAVRRSWCRGELSVAHGHTRPGPSHRHPLPLDLGLARHTTSGEDPLRTRGA